jgi:TetR/AcrR family transcriptional regulator, repressor for neighboring sulfatase
LPEPRQEWHVPRVGADGGALGEQRVSGSDSGSRDERIRARDALLKAAEELFAEKGIEAVSTREIAAKAHVNSGLVHRHFGNKEALLREVLENMTAQISALDPDGEESAILMRFFQAVRERETYWKLLARTMLDGQPIDYVQGTFPTIGFATEVIRELQSRGKGPTDFDPRAVAALVTAMAFGWLVFEPWLIAASGYHEDEKTVAGREAIRLVKYILTHSKA